MIDQSLETDKRNIEKALNLAGKYRAAIADALAAEISADGVKPETLDQYEVAKEMIDTTIDAIVDAWSGNQGRRERILSNGEFFCLKCGTFISSESNACPDCGWTWLGSSV